MPQESLEEKFRRRFQDLGGPALVGQFVFHPSRKWKLDWAEPDSRVAVEIHGGTWTHGRHVSGTGFWGDRIKINAAIRLNWKVFELIANDLEDDRVYLEIIDEVARRKREGVNLAERDLSPFAQVFAETKSKQRRRRNSIDGASRSSPAEFA